MIIDAAGFTDIGLRRSTNQDSILIRAERNRGFFVIADGMGGHSSGDYASQNTVKALASWWDKTFAGGIDKNIEILARECQEEIVRVGNAMYEQFSGMNLVGGTTIAAVIADSTHYAVLTVGDSRVYRYTADGMVLLSSDDVWENQEAVRASMTQEQIVSDSRYGKLTSAVGALRDVKVHTQIYEQMAEEYLMLCSDGVYKYCGSEQLVQELAENSDSSTAGSAVEAIAELIRKNGAADNFTVAICHTAGNMAPISKPVFEKGPNCDISIFNDEFSNPVRSKSDEKPSGRKILLIAAICVVLAAIIIVMAVFVIPAMRGGKNDVGDNTESIPSDSSSEITETSLTPETSYAEQTSAEAETMPVQTEGTAAEAAFEPLIMVLEPSLLNTNALSTSCEYYGDFDGNGAMDGVRITFEENSFGIEPVLTLIDGDGVPLDNSSGTLQDIINLQYSESDVAGLMSPQMSSETALFASVVNHNGRDYIVVYYASAGLTGNKLVSIISSSGTGLNLVNMYCNVNGSQQVMYPVSGANPELSQVDQMCLEHIGTEFVNVGENEIRTGMWGMGTQILGAVYSGS